MGSLYVICHRVERIYAFGYSGIRSKGMRGGWNVHHRLTFVDNQAKVTIRSETMYLDCS